MALKGCGVTQFGREFEEEVRQVARWIWNLPAGAGASDFIAGHEIDCVCRTDDLIHLLECTAQRSLDKVRDDADSLLKAKRHLENQGHTVKSWIITLHEPTPDQQAFARNHKIQILSLSQFRNRIFRANDYLNSRWAYRFGSASDPSSGAHILPDDEYVEVPLKDPRTLKEYSVQEIATSLIESKANVVLLGPFGAGKSLTVREIFRLLRKRHFKTSEYPIPVALNLRDHWGQEETDEALRRHGSRIGFEGRHELVKAWNAGLLVLLLDGFDELAAQSWRIAAKDMRNTRHEAVRLVRAFLKENQGRYGILITGRDHYFDSRDELCRSL